MKQLFRETRKYRTFFSTNKTQVLNFGRLVSCMIQETQKRGGRISAASINLNQKPNESYLLKTGYRISLNVYRIMNHLSAFRMTFPHYLETSCSAVICRYPRRIIDNELWISGACHEDENNERAAYPTVHSIPYHTHSPLSEDPTTIHTQRMPSPELWPPFSYGQKNVSLRAD